MVDGKELMCKETIGGLVEHFEKASQELRQGLAHLKTANQHMAAFGPYADVYPEDGPMPRHREMDDYLRDCLAAMKKTAWRSILRQTGILDRASAKRRDETESQIRQGEIPDVTLENVMGVLEGLVRNHDEIVTECIREAYEWVRPEGWSLEKYKTNWRNGRFTLGRKIIKSGLITGDMRGGFRLSYSPYMVDRLRSLDKAFHLLDGRGLPQYPTDLCTVIEQEGRKGHQECETPYFRCRWYRNGNLHIEIRRQDLLDAFNRVGADGSLMERVETA